MIFFLGFEQWVRLRPAYVNRASRQSNKFWLDPYMTKSGMIYRMPSGKIDSRSRSAPNFPYFTQKII